MLSENIKTLRKQKGYSQEQLADKLNVVRQTVSKWEKGYSVPDGRVKPWGTAQAMLAARNIIDEPFAVINADDFYGRNAYELLAKHLSSAKAGEFCMVGYIL